MRLTLGRSLRLFSYPAETVLDEQLCFCGSQGPSCEDSLGASQVGWAVSAPGQQPQLGCGRTRSLSLCRPGGNFYLEKMTQEVLKAQPTSSPWG